MFGRRWIVRGAAQGLVIASLLAVGSGNGIASLGRSGVPGSANRLTCAGSAPVNLTAPTLSGTFNVGETVTATTGSWDQCGSLITDYQYQWFSGGFPILDANDSVYALSDGDMLLD